MNRYINIARSFAENAALFLVDLVALVLLFELATFVRTSVLPFFYSGFPPELPFKGLMSVWWVVPVWMYFFYYEGLYTRRFSRWEETAALWKVSFFSTVGVFAIVSIGNLGGTISRTVTVTMGALAFLLLPLVRAEAKLLLKKLGLFRRRALILGAGKTGRLIADALRREPNYGYEVIGFLDDDPAKVGTVIQGIKVHKGVDQARQYIARCQIKDVIIAMPSAGKDKLQRLTNELQHRVERVLFVPDMFGVAVLGTSLQSFISEEAFAFEIRNNLDSPLNAFIKQCFDIVTSIVLIPLMLVPLAAIAVAIRLDSPGPAIFTQPRLGRRGRHFKLFKFRTMYEDAEERLTELLASDEAARKEYQMYWKLREDPRVTRIGRVLRATSLDELPQIFNIMLGEMSFVGPRPYLPREEADMGEFKETILLIKPGLTGLWQTSGRNDTVYSYRITLDLWYVRNWSLWLDLLILIKTVTVVLKREGAR